MVIKKKDDTKGLLPGTVVEPPLIGEGSEEDLLPGTVVDPPILQPEMRMPASEAPSVKRHQEQMDSKDSDEAFLKNYMKDNPELVDPKGSEVQTHDEKTSMVDSFIKGVEHTGIPAVGQGVLKATQELGNFAMDVSNWTEQFGQQIGIGDNELTFKDEDRLSYADDPDLVYQPDTMAGKVVSGIAQFLAPAGALGKMSKGIKAVTTLGKFSKASAIGSAIDFAVFDPGEERLSNLIQTQPMLRNPITAYLASNPKDSRAEGRFKNAIEGMGLGIAAEGLMKGIRAMRHSRFVDNVIKDGESVVRKAEAKGLTTDLPEGALPEEITAKEVAVTDVKAEAKTERQAAQQLDLFDEVSAPSEDDFITVKPITTEGEAAKVLRGMEDVTVEGTSMSVNFDNISTSKDVKKVIASMEETFPAEIDEARRGIITEEEARGLADETGLSFSDLEARQEGEAFNAEKIIATRRILNVSAERVSEIAKTITKDSTAQEKALFLQSIDQHRVVQTQASAVKAEAGRALQAFKQEVGMDKATRARFLDDTIRSFGGDAGIEELAGRLKDFDTREMSQVARKSVGRHVKDVAQEIFINGLLSGPWTHAYNMVSNTSTVMLSVAERKFAEIASKGAVDGVAAGEAKAMYVALMSGMRDSLEAGVKNFKTGKSKFGARKFEFTKAISSKEFNMDPNSSMSGFVDMLGTINRTPTRLLESSDEVFKMMNFRMEIAAQAQRKSARAKIAQGLTDAETLDIFNDSIKNYGDDIKLEAMEFAQENTFTKDLDKVVDGEVVPNVKLRGMDAMAIDRVIRTSAPMRVVTPFTKTNLNLVEYALNRTPIAVGLRDDLAAGGVRAATAKARIGTGMSVFAMTTSATIGGAVTGKGPSDHKARKALEATGWKPYTITVAGKSIPYNRLEPIGSIMAASADVAEIIGSLGSDRENDAQEIAIQTAAVFAHLMTPEFLLEGVSDFLQALGGDEKKVDRITGNLGSALIPLSSLQRTARQAIDPIKRETRVDPENNIPDILEKMFNSIRNTIPGLSSDLPPRKNVFGEIETYRSWYLGDPDDNSPFAADIKEDAVVKEIRRLNLVGPQAIDGNEALDYLKINKPDKFIIKSIGGQRVTQKLNPEQYDRLVDLSAGIGLESAPDGLTLRESLNQEIEEDFPNLGSANRTDEAKRLIIGKIISGYRKAAKQEFLMGDEDIQEQFLEKGSKKLSTITGEDIDLQL